MYRHFKRQAIFDGIIAEMNNHFKEAAGQLGINGASAQSDRSIYINISENESIKTENKY